MIKYLLMPSVLLIGYSCQSPEVNITTEPKQETESSFDKTSMIYEFTSLQKEIIPNNDYSLKNGSNIRYKDDDKILIQNGTNRYLDIEVWTTSDNTLWTIDNTYRIQADEILSLSIAIGKKSQNYSCRVAGDQSQLVNLLKDQLITSKTISL